MTKTKSIFLLIIVSILLAVLAVATFLRFPVGIYDYNGFLGAIRLDYDLEGGTAYTLTYSKTDNTEAVEDIDEVTSVLNSRMAALGYQTYEITTLKDMTAGVTDYKIRIVTKYNDNLSSDIAVVTAYGEVEFLGGTDSNPTTAIMDEENAIADATVVEYDDGTGVQYYVALELTDYGYDELIEGIKAAETAESSYYLKVNLGGETILQPGAITADNIQNKTISLTSGDLESANRMALQLSTGGLKYKYDVDVSDEFSPILGENTSLYVLISISAMLVLAMVFFAVKYKGYGLIASLSLLTFFLVFIAMLVAVPGVTVSLAGVLGAVFASALVVDGLIIIIKRITEESELGKTVKASIKTGYKRSLFPILNTNVIALVIGLALFILTQGFIRNFAAIFSIGVAISFATTVLVSSMFTWLILPLLKNPEKFLKLNDKVGE